MTAEELKKLPEEEILNFIRKTLSIDSGSDLKNHYRFNMSGYESETGDCTVKNMEILNKFAHLGIYDHTNFLFLDFYKGTPTLYFEYFWPGWGGFNNLEFSGYTTSEIIYEIFKLTIFSGTGTRRRS